jgi:hypothetical protein
MNPNFAQSRPIWLEGFDGNLYALFRSTWELKLSHPERAHVQYNYDKLVQTIKVPDEVRRSIQDRNCFIAYKRFEVYWVVPGVSAPTPPGIKYFAVVADEERNIIRTFYPTRKMKEGARLWPRT